jgi:hypothetical protein
MNPTTVVAKPLTAGVTEEPNQPSPGGKGNHCIIM